MTEFVSEIKTLPHSQQVIYEALSDLNNLELFKDKIPGDKINEFSFDRDTCSFTVNPVGKVKFLIVNREPPETIKFVADESPVEVNMWIQLKEESPEETKMKLTIQAELNPFLKPMLSKPLQDGINKIADVLAVVPYDEIMAKK
ncbi:MAG: SRPBCC family protein [Dysgonamonadaceae bacterium]|nr:SRPBCC family protein [Dysgonamonadaceae bacterium]